MIATLSPDDIADYREEGCHYVGGSAEQVSRYYRPLYRRDGSEVVVAESPTDGGPWGNFVARGPH